jgi:hypothetical protein
MSRSIEIVDRIDAFRAIRPISVRRHKPVVSNDMLRRKRDLEDNTVQVILDFRLVNLLGYAVEQTAHAMKTAVTHNSLHKRLSKAERWPSSS